MKSTLARMALLVTPLLLGGCCYFMPCHPATYIAGTVVDAESHRPIYNAVVRLYYYETRSAHSGCFALGGADAPPFDLAVSAPGYKPVVVKAVPGSYWTSVTLTRQDSAGASILETREMGQERYVEFSRNCR